MNSVEPLLEIAGRRPRGPSPIFDAAHILLAFLTIGEGKFICRHALASRTGLGEGSIRKILKKLRDEGYEAANASGCFLTPAGKRVYKSILKKLSAPASFRSTPLTIGEFQVALAVRNGRRSVSKGIEQRDSATRVGAAGATTYLIRSNMFTIPDGSSDCEKDFPSKAWSTLRTELKPRNGDAVVISGAGDLTTAKLGALAAAATLL